MSLGRLERRREMRTEKRNAFLSGLCGVAVALGMMAATSVHAAVTTERGASILAFPKILADTDSDPDTIVQITNISNNMVHARCFYVNDADNLWQVTDFQIWLTKQQPTQWQVSTGRFVNPSDTCNSSGGQYYPNEACSTAGLDPGAVPPVPDGFEGELKCVEVDVADNPIGGNHLKGEATLFAAGDVSKYNAIGIQGTDLAGETGNELLLNQPLDSEEVVGQYDACPNVLLLNHFSEGVTDPVLFDALRGGTCSMDATVPCYSDANCPSGTCLNGPQILDPITGDLSLRSATLTDLTLIPCTQDYENSEPESVTVQFDIYNEFEERLSASTTVICWDNFFLYEVDSPNDPERSVFAFGGFGTVGMHTRIKPVAGDGAVLGVAGVSRADAQGNVTRAALNLHMEGDRFSGTDGEIVDVVTLPGN
ncbi:MAG: hypothetical protein ACRDUX_35670 [Mycobacterium sp.]